MIPLRQVRALLRNYLADDAAAGLETQHYMSLNEIIRDGKVARDKQRVSKVLTSLTIVPVQILKYRYTQSWARL